MSGERGLALIFVEESAKANVSGGVPALTFRGKRRPGECEWVDIVRAYTSVPPLILL